MSNRTAPPRDPAETYLSRAFDDDRYAWTRVRSTRRWLVLAEVILLAALAVCTAVAAVSEAGWTIWYTAVWTVGLLAFIPIHSLANASIRGLYDRSGRSLDEHQLRLRDRSHAALRWVSGLLTFAAWTGAVAVASGTGHVRLALATGFLLWFAASLLPYWHLGWTLPDEESPEAV